MFQSLPQYDPIKASGQLIQVDALAGDNEPPPYVAVLHNIFMIGQLLVHCSAKGLYALNLDQGSVSGNFVPGVSPKQARQPFETACDSMHSGAFLALHNLRFDNFWHWTMEALVRVVTAQAAGFKGTYILPSVARRHSFIFESLSMLGISADQLILYDGQGWHLETLWIPEPIQATHGLRRYPLLLQALRKAMLKNRVKPKITFERVYIARDNPELLRRVANEMELMHLLFKYDFQRVVIERLPLQDQIGLMAEARCLVVPHGSGTVHSLFMSPQSLVVELFDANYVNPCMLPTMEFLKHRYFMIPNASLNKLEDGHFLVNTYCLDVTLKRELEEQNGVMAIA